MTSLEDFKKIEIQLRSLVARCSELSTELAAAGLYEAMERMESVVNTAQAEVARKLAEKRTGRTRLEGWVWLANTSDYHYFKGGKSLCGRWTIPTAPKFVERAVERQFNCSVCVKRIAQGK